MVNEPQFKAGFFPEIEQSVCRFSGVDDRSVRIRPKNWEQIKSRYRIGWAESERKVCLQNLAPLTAAAKAELQIAERRIAEQEGDLPTINEVRPFAIRQFGGPLRCPSSGTYELDRATGNVRCSHHGLHAVLFIETETAR